MVGGISESVAAARDEGDRLLCGVEAFFGEGITFEARGLVDR